MNTFLDKVGFELEGGWAGTPGVSPFPDLQLIADHSINGQTLKEQAIAATHIGEAVSPPFPYLEEATWVKWLEEHWPNAEPPDRVNATCGYHIHVSVLSQKSYTLLTSKVFLFELRKAVLEWGVEMKLPAKHAFWRRVDGGNTFCAINFQANKQMALQTKANGIARVRYGWLNFASGVHGTVEFRALPTFRDATVGIFFARKYFSFIDSYLANTINSPLKLSEESFT